MWQSTESQSSPPLPPHTKTIYNYLQNFKKFNEPHYLRSRLINSLNIISKIWRRSLKRHLNIFEYTVFYISNLIAKALGLNLGKKLSNLLSNREALN